MIYTVPLLVAALVLPPRGVYAAAALVVGLDLGDAILAAAPIDVWPYTLLALVITGTLAIRLSTERRRSAHLAHEAEQARLRRFVGMVSHDLAGPTFAIAGIMRSSIRTATRSSSRSAGREVGRWWR